MKQSGKKQDQPVVQVREGRSVLDAEQELADLELERKWFSRTKQDPEEFERIVHKYYEQIFGLIFKRTRDRDLAHDLTNETFARTWDALPRFQWRGVSIGAYLYQVAINCLNGWWKKEGRNIETPQDPQTIEVAVESRDEENLLVEEESNLLFSLLSQMSKVQQEVFFYSYRAGMSVKEISVVLDLNEATVKSHLHRGRKDTLERMTSMGLDQTSFAGILNLAQSALLREDGWEMLGGREGALKNGK